MAETTIRQRRKVTAAYAAKKLGVSMRTIKNYQAEYRNVYEQRAAERRKAAYLLRRSGKSWKEVGEALECSAEAARSLAKRYIQIQMLETQEPERDPNTLELF